MNHWENGYLGPSLVPYDGKQLLQLSVAEKSKRLVRVWGGIAPERVQSLQTFGSVAPGCVAAAGLHHLQHIQSSQVLHDRVHCEGLLEVEGQSPLTRRFGDDNTWIELVPSC